MTHDDCTGCEQARQRAKEEGHRNWSTGFVCYDHAAFDLNSPKGRALMADVTEDMVRKACKHMGIPYVGPIDPGSQPDLFGEAA
jgi:hypothetical protein